MDLPINIDIASLDAFHRRALEDVLGKELKPNQRLVIQVENASADPGRTDRTQNEAANTGPGVKLPDYCNVYEGLSEAEIAEVEASILQRSPSR